MNVAKNKILNDFFKNILRKFKLEMNLGAFVYFILFKKVHEICINLVRFTILLVQKYTKSQMTPEQNQIGHSAIFTKYNIELLEWMKLMVQ